MYLNWSVTLDHEKLVSICGTSLCERVKFEVTEDSFVLHMMAQVLRYVNKFSAEILPPEELKHYIGIDGLSILESSGALPDEE